MKLSLMQLSDFNQALNLWKKAGLSMAENKIEQHEVYLTLKLNPTTCFVLKDKDKIIGTILGAFNGRRAWIYHLAVHSDHRNKGHGSVLVKKVEDALKKIGATKINLMVAISNSKTVSFYEKLGYQKKLDAITMVKKLT